MDSWKLLESDSVTAAKRLLGCELTSTIGGQTVRGRIVETEAYDQTDAASHSSHGRTSRTEVMFGPAGHLYVYFTYGMYYCCNVVVGQEGYGSAVLIRAIEPLEGEAVMSLRRRGLTGVQLTNGPAKTCQALAVDKQLNGHMLREQPLILKVCDPLLESEIVQTVRVGITKAADTPWRFYIRGNKYVSRS